jgi:hypothetical protein
MATIWSQLLWFNICRLNRHYLSETEFMSFEA